MSSNYFPQLFGAAALVILWLVNVLLLWSLNHQWWRLRSVRRVMLTVPVPLGLVMIALWALATANGWSGLIPFAAGIASAILVLLVASAIALPFSGIVLTIERAVRAIIEWRDRRSDGPVPAFAAVSPAHVPEPAAKPVRIGDQAQIVDRRRRSFITRAAAVIPAATLSTSAYGLIAARGNVRMPNVPLYFPDLPAELEGLRILHLSDIHIGYYVGLEDLEEVMMAGEAQNPDMVLVSGDISDDISQLPDAMRMIAGLKARYGTYASLGNHEYFRGIQQILKIIDAGPIPLLRDSGTSVKVGNAEIYIGGADDPVRMNGREQNLRFLERSVDAAFDGAPSGAFNLLMSHRPEGLDVAAERGIGLTVSGHTHGAQVGFNGRSVLEPWMPQRYLWGHYERNGSQLYTSAGVGHWFPFRLGCPAEAPVYILRRKAT